MAARSGDELPVKFFLHLREEKPINGGVYANARDRVGATPLLKAVRIDRCSPRLVRMLINAGADTTSTVRITDNSGDTVLSTAPPWLS